MENPTTITPVQQPFLDLSNLGRNEWYRYLITIFIVFMFWQVIGGIPYVILYAFGKTSEQLPAYLALNFTFIAMLVGLWISMRGVHQRSLLSLISPSSRIQWSRIILAAAIWLGITTFITMIDAWMHPGSYQLTFQWGKWLPFSLLALVFTSIQTSAEEILFRGYFLQGMARITRNGTILCVLSGVIFAVPHFLNPEMEIDFLLLALFYFSFGVFLGWITLRSQSLELALGVHAANNLFSVIIANYEGSALPSPSMFTAFSLDPLFSLVSFIAGALVFAAGMLMFFPEMIKPTVLQSQNAADEQKKPS